jgi:hypothetical protein
MVSTLELAEKFNSQDKQKSYIKTPFHTFKCSWTLKTALPPKDNIVEKYECTA